MTIAYATLLLCCFPLVAQAQGLGSATSRFSWDNDFYFFRDAQISNVFSYQRHFSAQADPEDDLAWQRESWSIQQTMQTPNKDTPMNQLSKDVPFVGTLVGQKSWYTFNNNDLQGYAISVGVVGDLSMADKTQALIHRWRGVEVYAGWSDQYPNELILNVHAMKKWKMMRGKHWDVAGGGNVALGNMVNHVGGADRQRVAAWLCLCPQQLWFE